MTCREALDALVAWATPDAGRADLLLARAAYFGETGEVFDGDALREVRMQGFLEWYVCDRPRPATALTPAEERLQEVLRAGPPEAVEAARPFVESFFGLFELLKVGGGQVTARHLTSGVVRQVAETRLLSGLQEGDVTCARIVCWQGADTFTHALEVFPRKVAPLIRAEAQRRAARGQGDAELVLSCAQRHLRSERYKQVALERLFDFSA